MVRSKFWFLSVVLMVSPPAFAGDAAPFSLHDLLTLVDKPGTESLETLVPRLPEELLANHTFMATSQSRQKGTRALLFRAPATRTQTEIVAMAFKPELASPARQTLEVMAYNPQPKAGESTLELYEISFPPARGVDGKVIPPRKNPKSCSGCHGSDPHPIWGTYHFWPDALGSDEDLLQGEEIAQLEKMRASPLGKLLHPPKGSVNTPYQPPGSGFGDRKFRPNLRLSELLSSVGAQRLARSIASSPLYPKYRTALAISAFCGFHEDPPAFWSRVNEELVKDLRSDLLAAGITPEAKSSDPNALLAKYFDRTQEGLSGRDERIAILEALGIQRPEWKLESEISRETEIDSGYFDGTYYLESLIWPAVLEPLVGKLPSGKRSIYGKDTPFDAWDERRVDSISPLPFDGEKIEDECPKLMTRARGELAGRAKAHRPPEPSTH